MRALFAHAACYGLPMRAQTFTQAVQAIVTKPEFAHANFGVELYSLDTQQPIFSLNASRLFTPGSTTKLLTVGTALQLLGPDFRFHTLVYRTGDVNKHGVLKGDLVLVASGDPNLSGRIRNDGTLVYQNEDHSYGGVDAEALPGDPLAALRELAGKIYAGGIRKVDGQVFVDATLFNPD